MPRRKKIVKVDTTFVVVFARNGPSRLVQARRKVASNPLVAVQVQRRRLCLQRVLLSDPLPTDDPRKKMAKNSEKIRLDH